MASSPLRLRSPHHGRSRSLPSISHSATSQFDENLSTSIASSDATLRSLSSLNKRVTCLKSLYSNLHIQHIISQDKWVDEVLEDHINVLDACNKTRDIFSQMKYHIQELLSAIRRKDIHGVHSYLTCRKRSQKMIQKSLKDLKCLRNKKSISADKDNKSEVFVCKLKEAETATLAFIESLLSYVMQSRQSGWSTVSKLMSSSKVSEDRDLNEFKKVDNLLQKGQDDSLQSVELVNHLKEMESNIQVLEDELQCFYRQLIKTRVFLLNNLNC